MGHLMKAEITEEYVSVGGEVTHITKCGHSPRELLIIMIPGNPGAALYYKEFTEVLYAQSNNQVPVWCVSHAGHVTIPKQHENKSTSGGEYYTLQGQIRHKLQFIDEHVPRDTKVILLGHSIGAYIILHMLEELGSRVLKCGLLFLTIERLAMAPKGLYMTPLLRYFRWAAPLLMYPVSWLPAWFHRFVVSWYFTNRPVHPGAVSATQQLVSSSSMRNIVNMANEEFQNVVVADYDLLERHLAKLWFYYGSCDHWCPVEYYTEMRKRYPDGDITLCDGGFKHAFCLEASAPMAQRVWKYLKECVIEVNEA